ncbi:outer membrane lipoprotein carrier protein LolA [Natronorubrum sp. A-ect3]|uniref:LolA family protein n=1 Tax=Natronorubrum sp. A-ect3 TaxID=3242698 RepID=UPI00359DF5C6
MRVSAPDHVPLRVAAALFLTVVLAGCVAVPDAGLSQDSLEDQLNDTEPPDELSATVEISETIDGETSQRTETVWLRADGTSRIETTTNGSEQVIVSDGTDRYIHDLERDAIRSYERDPNAKSLLEGLSAQPDRYLDAYDVTALEEVQFDGQDAYRVEFEPPANETIERSVGVQVAQTEYVFPLETTEADPDERSADRVELWLEQETLFPVKHTIAGDGIELTTTYRNLSINGGLADDLFEPPTAADNDTDETEFVFPTIDQYDTVADAEAAAPFAVAEPSADALPDAVSFDGASSYEFHDKDRRQVSLFYRSEAGESVAVTTSDGPRAFATDGDSVSVGETTGTLEATEQGTELQWSCDGLYYSVFVSDAVGDAEDAIVVGESLGFEC